MNTIVITRGDESASDEAAVMADRAFVAAGLSEAMTIEQGAES